MAIRGDVSVNWEVSPRIITVASPSTEIVMQDLLDTLRSLEAAQVAIDNPSIVDAAGKEPLGGSVFVGLTVSLLNAKLAFQARPGPTYVQCNATGGNLVAFDDVGASISAIEPTAFTQVLLTSSSSATLQGQEQQEIASFQGGVAIDTSNGEAGTAFPIGTREYPSNNLADAHTIAEARGLRDIFVMSNLALTGIDVSDGYRFVGDSPVSVTITIDPSADVTNAEFMDASVQGTLDGSNVFRQCVVGDVNYINGFIFECALNGTITLGGASPCTILNSWSNVTGLGTPTIDMGGSGNLLQMRDYHGGITLTNCTGGGATSLDISSGRVIFDATISAGDFYVRGIADVTDNSTGTATVYDNTINASVADTLTVDEFIGLSG